MSAHVKVLDAGPHEDGAAYSGAGARNDSGERWTAHAITRRNTLAAAPDRRGDEATMAGTCDRVCWSRTMKTIYDAEADALYVRFVDATIAKSEEVSEGVVLDFDVEGRNRGNRAA